VIKTPWPSMLRTIYGDPERFVNQYWKTYQQQGWYVTGDSARKDEDGYIWIIGRNDDVIKVSGYRLGTAEIESGLVSHPAVAEAAAIGVPDEVRGNVIYAYCILRANFQANDALREALKEHIRHEVGPIAVPTKIEFVDALPKTRSGKIMRRVLKAQATGQPLGDTSTLEE
ncbi:MAG: AMP-binding protein, partial [Anaerolinea sp.]|nr:AMP-binding protein [Anaerolinea sp.]